MKSELSQIRILSNYAVYVHPAAGFKLNDVQLLENISVGLKLAHFCLGNLS